MSSEIDDEDAEISDLRIAASSNSNDDSNDDDKSSHVVDVKDDEKQEVQGRLLRLLLPFLSVRHFFSNFSSPLIHCIHLVHTHTHTHTHTHSFTYSLNTLTLTHIHTQT